MKNERDLGESKVETIGLRGSDQGELVDNAKRYAVLHPERIGDVLREYERILRIMMDDAREAIGSGDENEIARVHNYWIGDTYNELSTSLGDSLHYSKKEMLDDLNERMQETVEEYVESLRESIETKLTPKEIKEEDRRRVEELIKTYRSSPDVSEEYAAAKKAVEQAERERDKMYSTLKKEAEMNALKYKEVVDEYSDVRYALLGKEQELERLEQEILFYKEKLHKVTAEINGMSFFQRMFGSEKATKEEKKREAEGKIEQMLEKAHAVSTDIGKHKVELEKMRKKHPEVSTANPLTLDADVKKMEKEWNRQDARFLALVEAERLAKEALSPLRDQHSARLQPLSELERYARELDPTFSPSSVPSPEDLITFIEDKMK